MYVTAHRVRDGFQQEGINAYLYSHGGYVWEPPAHPPSPFVDPGVLVNTLLSIDVNQGNLVRSYLDIVAPDDFFWPQLRPRFMQFIGAMQLTPFPWSREVGGCLFQVGMVNQLAAVWKHELPNLYRACEIVHPVLLI